MRSIPGVDDRHLSTRGTKALSSLSLHLPLGPLSIFLFFCFGSFHTLLSFLLPGPEAAAAAISFFPLSLISRRSSLFLTSRQCPSQAGSAIDQQEHIHRASLACFLVRSLTHVISVSLSKTRLNSVVLVLLFYIYTVQFAHFLFDFRLFFFDLFCWAPFPLLSFSVFLSFLLLFSVLCSVQCLLHVLSNRRNQILHGCHSSVRYV